MLVVKTWARRALPLSAVLLLAGTVGALADTPPAVYSGCQNVATGVLRLLPNRLPVPYNDCIMAGNGLLTSQPRLLEVKVSWNKVGPQGPAGPQGFKGDMGVQGPKGDKGDAGGIGPQGLNGGPGLKGDTGSAGAQGPIGPAGGLASFDSLRGLPCEVGTTNAGTIAVNVDPTTRAVSLKCNPTTQAVTVSVIAQDGLGAYKVYPATVTSDVGGIACSNESTSICSRTIPVQNVWFTLHANVAPGWNFTGWGGDCSLSSGLDCTLTAGVSHQVSAGFIWGVGLEVFVQSGTVTVSARPACSTIPTGQTYLTCRYFYEPGTAVAMSSGTAATWSDACTGLLIDCSVTMNVPRRVAVQF
jgi:hypothetical protein